MLIAGIQKLSMVDFPGKLACTVFTGGCDLRCPYCHNSELWENPPKAMAEGELLAFLESRAGKLDGVCVTGGEPCIQKDLLPFLDELRKTELLIKLDTNGSRTDVLKEVLVRGLADYVAVDIKSSPEDYGRITGIADYDMGPLTASVELLLGSEADFELRTTVVRPFHDRTTMEGIRDYLKTIISRYGRKIPHYYLQPFRDRETVPFSGLGTPEPEEMEQFAQILWEVAEQVAVR